MNPRDLSPGDPVTVLLPAPPRPAAAPPIDAIGAPGGSPHAVLEREAVLAQGAAVIAGAHRGRGGALLVIGESGQGKTSILTLLCERARVAARVVVARAEPMEVGLPYSLARGVFEQLGSGDPFAVETGARDVRILRAERFERARRLLRQAATAPLVIALDDLHWADDDSLTLVAYLLRRIATVPVAVIGTMRMWPPAAESMAEQLAGTGVAAIHRLAPLSECATRTLLASLAGRDVDDATAARAHALSAGNPLLLEQAARLLRSGAELADLPPAGGPGEDLILTRFAGFDETVLRCAKAASVLGLRFDSHLAATVARLPADVLSAAMRALLGAGLLRTLDGPSLEFVHPFLRWALYSRMPGFERCDLHGRAFAALYADRRFEEAAEHAIRGELRGSAAVDALTRAGRSALRRGAPSVAVQRLEEAVGVARGEVQTDVLLDLAEGLDAVAPARAVEVCEQLDAVVLTPRQRIEVAHRRARALAWTGDARGSGDAYAAAEELARATDAELAVQIVLDHVVQINYDSGPATARAVLGRALDLAPSVDEPRRRLVLAVRAWLDLFSGAASDLGPVDALAALDARPVGPGPTRWNPWLVLGRTYVLVERFADAEAAYQGMEDEAEATGALSTTALLLNPRAWLRARQGRIDAALEDLDRSLTLAQVRPYAEVSTRSIQAYVLFLAGRLDDCEGACRRVDELVESGAANTLATLHTLDVRGQRHLREGRAEAASDTFRRVEAAISRMGIGEPCFPPWTHHGIAAHLAADRVADAERVLAWVEERGRPLPCRHPRIAAAIGRALLAERAGSPEEAEGHLEEALGVDPEATLPIERVETLVAHGSFLRRSGRPALARGPLAEALALAERLGAHGLGRLATLELRVAGGRRRRRGEPSTLTTQEERVVRLVAVGLTNREVARQLVLSEATVETHLRRIYPKLGVRSRREIMLGLPRT